MQEQALLFVYGFLGSASQEILRILIAYDHDARRLPLKYRKPGYWAARVGLALIGGGLAIVLQSAYPANAIYIGASAPWILGSLASREQNPGNPLAPKDLDWEKAVQPLDLSGPSDHSGPTRQSKIQPSAVSSTSLSPERIEIIK